MSDLSIFHNELADRMTREYGEMMEAGLSHEVIVLDFINRYEEELVDDLQQAVFWITLAKIQVLMELSGEESALHPMVRENAVAAIRGLLESGALDDPDMKEDLEGILDDLLGQPSGCECGHDHGHSH
ncbi:MAG: hypothetical protein HPY50_16735 [Firmicutes bacterium]|nr:hypothetical protein [Bacillota bacterium]